MHKNLALMVSVLFCLLAITALPSNSFGGLNSLAACSLDMDITTSQYESEISTVDIESNVDAGIGEMIIVGVIAQGVRDLDTYQVEVRYNISELQFIEGYEDDPMTGIENLLKTNGGTSIGFQAKEKEPGLVNIANTLIGKDQTQTPEGTGVIALLRFKVLKDGPSTLTLTNVHFVDSFQKEDIIKNTIDGNIN